MPGLFLLNYLVRIIEKFVQQIFQYRATHDWELLLVMCRANVNYLAIYHNFNF